MYKYILLIPTIPICLIKTYTYLSYVSMAGVSCALAGGILMLGYCGDLISTGQASTSPPLIFDVSNFFGYIGIAMFVFEGNGVVINLNAVARN